MKFLKTGNSSVLKYLGRIKESPIILFTIVVYIIFSALAPNFNNLKNVSVIVEQIAINGIAAIGMTIVIMIGGMDLSVGSILALCGVTAAMMDNQNMPLPLIIAVTLIVGILAGTINGLIITRLKIPDIIVTLAMMNIYRGIAVIVSDSRWITDFSSSFKAIGSSKNSLLSIPVLTFAAVIAVIIFILKKTPYGRLFYAVGGNQEAAKIMGLNVNKVKILVYAINGLLLAISGILFASMYGSIQASKTALTLQFQTMGSALIGGANIFGGSGTVIGTVFGVFLLGMIKNGLIQVHASEYWLDFLTGAIILLALVVNLIKIKKKGE